MKKLLFTLFPLVLFACSTPKLTEYRGPDVFEGQGGTVETIDGIDFWKTGTPNCKFKLLGTMEYNPESFAIDAISKKVLIAKVKEVGGDAVIFIDKEKTATGIRYHFAGFKDAQIDYSTEYLYAVVKYLE